MNELEIKYVKTFQGNRAEPILAVDHVCAWPNSLTKLRDGTIAAFIFNKPSHAWIKGDTVCWASDDSGRTWNERGTSAPADAADPHMLRAFKAAGLAHNGDLVVICAGFSNAYPPGKSGRPFRARMLAPWVSRSPDGGHTWTIDKQTFPTKAPDGGELWPYGQIVQGDNGALYASIYSSSYSMSDELHPDSELGLRETIYSSRDDGKTWGKPICMDNDNPLSETSLLRLGDGKWLAAARHRGLHLYESSDDSQTWRFSQRLTEYHQHPGHLLRLSDGRLVLSYGDRTKGATCVRMRHSDDEGKTWSESIRVADTEHNDSGHPSSIQLDDGAIVTAYYTARISTKHVSYFMGVVIWDLDESLNQ